MAENRPVPIVYSFVLGESKLYLSEGEELKPQVLEVIPQAIEDTRAELKKTTDVDLQEAYRKSIAYLKSLIP